MSKIVTFALLADTHLCRSQYGRTTRREQIRRSLENAINEAHNAGIRYILHAGDLLDSNNPGVEVAVGDLLRINQLLRANKMQMYVIRGNHDNCDPSWWHTFEQTSESEYGIRTMPEAFNIEGVKIRSRGWGQGNAIQTDMLMPDFGDFNIAVYHGEIAELVKYPTEFAVSEQTFYNEERLEAGTWPQVIVVGHVHTQLAVTLPVGKKKLGFALLSPGSTDITVKPQEGTYNEPARMLCVTFEVPDKGRAVLKTQGFVEYEATRVRTERIISDEDVSHVLMHMRRDMALTADDEDAERGFIYYISYAPTAKNCIPRLQEFLQGNLLHNFTLVAQPIQETSLEDMEVEGVADARTIKMSPAQYFAENRKDYAIKDDELADVCTRILTPTENSKQVLDAFVDKKIGSIIL